MGHQAIQHEKKIVGLLAAKTPLRGETWHLDVGSGDGEVLQHFVSIRRLASSIGLEPNIKLCRIAANRRYRSMTGLRAQTLEGFLEHPERPKFHVVTAFEVLEHVIDPVSMLLQIRSLMNVGGKLLLTVPDREALRGVICPDCGRNFHPSGHLHSCNENSVFRMLRSAHFRAVYSIIYRPTWSFALGLPDPVLTLEIRFRGLCPPWCRYPGKWIGVVAYAN